MTMVAEFDAAPERLWNLWEDPRKLERWYGPAPYPATFTRYEFEPGGQCRYCMTGPERLHASTAGGGSTRSMRHAGSSSSTASPATTVSRFPGLEPIERRRHVRAASPPAPA